jgi:oligopeptide transport system substrate-binding protein
LKNNLIHKFPKLLLPLLVVISLIASSTAGCTNLFSPSSSTSSQNTLNLAGNPPVTLDPALVGEVNSASFVVQIFSGLVQFDEKLQLVPDIAQTWDVSSDGTVYTFHLSHNAQFQNGKPVTAADFKYSWERALLPVTQSSSAGTYLNDVVGAIDMLTGKATQLSGVQVVDDYTLKVTLDAPKAAFLEKMGFPTAFVVDKANIQSGGANWWMKPNGTGPFKLSQFTQSQLVLSRNDNYYGEKAKLDQVVFQLYAGSSMQLYQENSIDVAGVNVSYMSLVTDPSNSISKELKLFPELSVGYLGFNVAEPPFDDVKVRQAFCYAVDMNRVIALGIDNVVTTAGGILPPELPGYNSNLQSLKFDPIKAKQLIAASKYGDVSKLPPIVLTTQGWGSGISGILGGIIDQWRLNLGVEVTVRQLEPEIFPYILIQDKTEVDQIFDTGWIADYPDPQDFLAVLFHSSAGYNSGSYSNPQVDSLLDKAAIEKDTPTRLKMYQQAEQILIQDAAVLPEYFGRSYYVIKPYVNNFNINPLGYASLNKVTIKK